MTITIRRETEPDSPAIREVTIKAFSSSELGHHGEADVIERLRANCPEVLSLVAEQEGRIVGHVLFSPVLIEGENLAWEGMGLAPMAVLPELQGQGIGSRLVESGLQRLAESQCQFVVVLGHPEFYARLGFEPAGKHCITCEFLGIPEEVFRIQKLAAHPAKLPKGVARYRPEFSVFEAT
jgi:putative acetyltransferase